MSGKLARGFGFPLLLVTLTSWGCGIPGMLTASLPWTSAAQSPGRILSGEPEERIITLAFSPDGTMLASGGSTRLVKLWSVASGEVTRILAGHAEGVTWVGFSPDGKTLATAGYGDGIIKLWELATGKERASISTGDTGYPTVTFSPDGTRLAAVTEDKTLTFWDVASGKAVPGPSPMSGFWGVAYSPDGKRIASTTQGKEIDIWDTRSGNREQELIGHSSIVLGVTFSPDGTRLASRDDNSIRLWDSASWENAVRLPAPPETNDFAFSPDGKLLAASWRGGIMLWDGATGREVRDFRWRVKPDWGDWGEILFPGSMPRDHGASCIAFSPDGASLASGISSYPKSDRTWAIALWAVPR